jgi:hypothetical protein
MNGLLTLDEFRVVRDEMALASMLERGDKLFHASEKAWAESRVYKKRMDAASKRERPLIEADYDKAMRTWGECEAEIGAIERDARFVAWKAKQLAETA